MRLRSLIVGGALAILAAAVACTKTSPTRPSDVENASPAAASVTDARTGATIVAARPLSPAANASFKWTEQPFTLTITNGVTTGSSLLTYTFEVARDAGFAQKDYTKENVAAGSAGTTSVALDKLSGSRTYYWRVRVSSASTAGPYSAIRAFTVGPEVVLGTPVLASVTAPRTTGPPGISDRFRVIGNGVAMFTPRTGVKYPGATIHIWALPV